MVNQVQEPLVLLTEIQNTLLMTEKETERSGLLPPNVSVEHKQKAGFTGIFPTLKTEKMESRNNEISQGQSPKGEHL